MRSFVHLAVSVSILACPAIAGAQSRSAVPARDRADGDILVQGPREGVVTAADLATAASATLSGAALDERKAPSLGATLARLPGVQNGYFGPAAGRPEIRGQSGNRVALLVDGLATQDASGASGDHAAPVDPFLVDRIDVLKGSAAVLYGGNAIGGAVNVVDGRIPVALPERPLMGRAEVQGGVNTGVTGAARIDGGRGGFAWHVDGLYRYAQDFTIPGEAKADACRSWSALVSNAVLQGTCQVKLARPTYVYDAGLKRYVDATPLAGQIITDPAPGTSGRLANSALRTTAVNAGGSFVGSAGYLGVAFGRYDSAYGVPGFGYVTAAHPLPSPVGLTVGQSRFDVRGALYDPLPGVAAVTLRAATTRATDREVIDGQDSSRLRIHADSLRIELTHRPLGPLAGVLGGAIDDRSLRTDGRDAYLPSVDTRERSLFLLESLSLAPLTLKAGGRHDWIDHDLDEATVRSGRGLGTAYAKDRSFRLWNASASARIDVARWLHLDGRYAHGERAPMASELYANGNHFAILTEEQGDGRLRKERSENWEIGGGIDARWFSLSATGYRVRYRDFLYLGNTGISRTLRVFEWRQADTAFDGVEGEASVRLPDVGIGAVTLHGVADHVVAKPIFTLPADYDPFASGSTPAFDAQFFRRRLDGDALPRTPVSRYGGDVAWTLRGWRAAAGAMLFARQDRVAKNEQPSPSYVLVDAHLGYGWTQGTTHWEAFVDATNLTDTEARPHNSFLRYRAPLPGRAAAAGLRTTF